MGLGRTHTVVLVGMAGHVVEVEAHIAPGLPAFSIVGPPDAALGEARERVRAAVVSCGIPFPARRVTVNLSPAALPKSGSALDVGVAVALLAAAGELPQAPEAVVHLGEVGLDGRIHPVRGVLPAILAAVAAGLPRVVVPAANLAEAELVPGARVLGVAHLARVLADYGADVTVPELSPVHRTADPAPRRQAPDLADVAGQAEARRALEVAAAGGHHLLLVGPPGTGKTMLAERLPGLLPDLPPEQAVEVTSVHSVAGTFDPANGLLVRPPFEAPHQTASEVSIVGGGTGIPRPGAASRAHRGVLFLDEAPEWSPRVLETLRQPLESGELVLHRAAGTARYPARFQLVLAANPCPCGRFVGRGTACTCTSMQRRRYFGRLSGPLLDRIDLQVPVLATARADLGGEANESSAAVAARVRDARDRMRHRWSATPWTINGEVPGAWLRRHHPAHPAGMADLFQAMDTGRLSLRGVDRVLRVAWTLTDLAGRQEPTRDDTAVAAALRTRQAHG